MQNNIIVATVLIGTAVGILLLLMNNSNPSNGGNGGGGPSTPLRPPVSPITPITPQCLYFKAYDDPDPTFPICGKPDAKCNVLCCKK